ncbi:magnesium transporter, partial [Lecanoromycetidae sp. Uapishka_2]
MGQLGELSPEASIAVSLLQLPQIIVLTIYLGEPAHNLDQLLVLLERRQFIIWMIAQAVLVVLIVIGAKSLKWMNPWSSNSPRMRLFRGMAYGGVSGILSAHSLLVAKSAVELLVRTIIDKHNEFNRWQSWMILLGLLSLALTQLYYLHRGLKLCSTSILYPFVFCVYNIIAILDGLIYFNQSSRLSLLHALLIALGTIILLLGVLALSWRLNNDPTTRPPVSQNPLTPGMGFVEDDSDSEVEANTLPSQADAEAQLANGNESPLYQYKTYGTSSPTDQRTPTTKKDDLLNVTRLRRKGITESEEIWEELEDDTLTDLSPFSRRRSSVQTRSSSRPKSQGKQMGDIPDEETALLRSGTGRSYRDKRRRRSAASMSTQERERRRKSAGSQEAVGGWWKMKRWFSGRGPDDKGKGPEGRSGNGTGNGNGNGTENS